MQGPVRLGLQVHDVMLPCLPLLSEGATIHDAAREMRDARAAILGVCDAAGRITGVLHDRDVVTRCLAVGGSALDPVDRYIRPEPPLVDPSLSVDEALTMMSEEGLDQLIVAIDRRPVGLLSQSELARRVRGASVGSPIRPLADDYGQR